jgi:hypothetical protein
MPVLTSEGLKSVMTALEAALVEKGVLDDRMQSKLAQMEGSLRYKTLMEVIANYRHPEGGETRDLAFPESVKSAFEKAINDQGVGPRLKEAWQHARDLRNQQRVFMTTILPSTVDEAHREFRSPEARKLKEAIVNSLPLDKQNKYQHAPENERDKLLLMAHLDSIRRAFFKASDMPRPDRDGPGRGRPGEYFPRDRDRDGDAPFRPFQGRKPEQPPEGRRRQTE